VWIEDPDAAAAVDLANTAYALMLRLLAQACTAQGAVKQTFIDLGVGLMRAVVPLAEQAARLPAGATHPACNAGMSFTALRDAGAFPSATTALTAAHERLSVLVDGTLELQQRLPTARIEQALKHLHALHARAGRGLPAAPALAAPTAAAAPPASANTANTASAATSTTVDGVESVRTEALTLHFEGKRCIHARHCVTGAPTVFLANVQGPWLHPETVPAQTVIEIAHACPSGAIRYTLADGGTEPPPPVNLLAVREAGPYALRGELVLQGQAAGTRATLCRCGASRNKPFCDGSHHEVGFAASGEPETGLCGQPTDMLSVRGGPLAIEPEPDGPLHLSGPLEITAGTGRMVCRPGSVRLCRCGGSSTKPLCDGTHKTNGFRA
jgi:CDGSH-type Zn-finger protein/uncharacterized Fe-S cluster protein YjdI